jgi:Glycosyl hydrolase family 26
MARSGDAVTRHATRTAVAVLCLLVVIACGAMGCAGSGTGTVGASAATSPATTASPSPVRTATLPDPRRRMLLGAYVSLPGEPTAEASIEQRERAIGRHYDLELTYYNWTDPFPDSGEAAIVAHGRAPVMAWYGPDKDLGSSHTLAEITDGSDDSWIARQAAAIKAFGYPIYLRLMPEMNENSYGYSGDPRAFIAAWRHIHDIFSRVGAANVVWVWCPNLLPDNWDSYYPGNAYVDVIGVDGYSNTTYTWQTFKQMFSGFFEHFAAFSGHKPQMVVETGTNSGAGHAAAGIGSAASFIDGMRSYLQDVAGPRYRVIGVCWFDTDMNGHDWRVDQTSAAWRAWLALARDPYFGGH